MEDKVPSRKRIQYIAPDLYTIMDFSEKVCEGLAETLNEPGYKTFEVRHGLSNFMMIVAKISTKALNAESENPQVSTGKSDAEANT